MKIKIVIVALAGLTLAACGGSNSTPPPAANIAPTISSIANQSTAANATSAAISFTVTDENVGGLSFTVVSDNQLVVPDAGLVLATNGATGSVSATPVPDTLGVATVTVTVTDQGGLLASTSFFLTIDPEQLSLQEFVRAEFAQAEDGLPRLINAVDFIQDADNDDFADLLAP